MVSVGQGFWSLKATHRDGGEHGCQFSLTLIGKKHSSYQRIMRTCLSSSSASEISLGCRCEGMCFEEA